MRNQIKVLTFLGILGLGIIFAFKPVDKKIIVIDAGHGGNDFGATLNDVQEKSIVEKIARKIKAQNNNENLEIVLLREGDHDMELKERVSMINNINPSLVISLHLASSPNFSKNGIEAYISSNAKFHDQSKAYAENLLEKVAANYFSEGIVKEAPFYILKNANCPSVSLDLGYLSNVNDRNYMTTEKGQAEIADKILEAVK
ncbi:N-acetylmuramoyl-L-alanine amidase family protein [Flavobacterium collinsii]|uniref:N-acetylmuramoyl-L-alanine amidase n=1 Tax=Flavobacterium collinsii TaxID=1114861 RepID=A0ABM8KP77_9FLAO|nr:N-acetylmuramoyl-L-alanine amidase [Flavobacterium collinsii]CAA9202491.1 N-acetylmuramoyl-L-alanine amidase LytC [Flavobacterium collinsii]